MSEHRATLRLVFPRSLGADQVQAFVAGVASALATTSRMRRSWVVAEVVAGDGLVQHFLHADGGVVTLLEQQLNAQVPALRWEHTSGSSVTVGAAVEVGLSVGRRSLRIDRAAAVSAACLQAIAAAADGETVVVQWLLGGARPARAVHTRDGEPTLEVHPSNQVVHGEIGSELRHKVSEPLLLGVCRIGVQADRRRSDALLGSVVGALRGSDGPGVRTTVRTLPSSWVRDRLSMRARPWLWPRAYNAAELTARICWPIDAPQVAGLTLGSARLLAPPVALSSDPDEGVVLAQTTFPGTAAPLVLRDVDRREHVHVMGPTGVGKSTLLAQMALQDIERGHAVIVLDPKGDLVDDITARLPERRIRDVILLDPADAERPVGYNPLAAAGRDLDLVVDSVAAVFSGLFSQYWGPRTDDILRASLLTLGSADREPDLAYTLCEVPALLTHQGFRRSLTTVLDDPIALQPFWAVYESLRAGDRAQVIAPLQNKLRAFLLRKSLRTMMGQSNPAWSIEQVFRDKQILLVPLRAGQIGEEAAQLLGSLVVARIWHATLARSRLDPSERTSVMVLLDEFHTLINVPTGLGDLLAQARGLGVAMTLAHQHLGQLSPELRRDLANTRNRVLFQLASEDARFFAKAMPEIEAEDLQGLPSREVFASLVSDAEVRSPASGRTIGLGEPVRDPDVVAAASRARFGVPAGAVEAALRERLPAIRSARSAKTKRTAKPAGKAQTEPIGEVPKGSGGNA